MSDSISDLIYLLAFGFLMLLISRRKKINKNSRKEIGQPSENQINKAPVKADKEPEIKKNVFSSSSQEQKKMIFKNEKDALFEPKLAINEEIDNSRPEAIKEAPKEENILDKSSSRDMVVLSAIYFNPYI